MKTFPLKCDHIFASGDDVAEVLLKCLGGEDNLEDGDVLVIAQSIVSKAEGNVVDLRDVIASQRAKEIAEVIGEDPRKVEVILDQTEEIVRLGRTLITRTKHGFVCANAGIDSSNVEEGKVTYLPERPDESADRIRKKIKEKTGKNIAVIISDSWGRPFRLGAIGFAIGVSGMIAFQDLRGELDIYGKKLENTTIAPPDSLAAIAALEMGEADEKTPAILIRESPYVAGEDTISSLIRTKEEDLFR